MTNAKKQAEEIAQLKKELAEVKAAVPKPQKSSAELERENREWMDQMHQMRERRMNFTTPPSVVRDMAGGVTEADCADLRRASHRPTGPSPMAPSSPPVTGVRRGVAGDGTGWSREISLGPSPHQRYVDAQLDAADARDKAERIRQEAQLTAMDRVEALHTKLTGGKK